MEERAYTLQTARRQLLFIQAYVNWSGRAWERGFQTMGLAAMYARVKLD